MEEKFVKVSIKRLAELLREEAKLISLESLGVDNWDGYGYLYDEDMNTNAKYLEDVDSKTDEELVKDYDIC